METDSKGKGREEKWLIHLYDNGSTWVAYERSAQLLSYIMGDFINVRSVPYQQTGSLIIKAEMGKQDFTRLVSPAYIIYDDTHHKILDFHISPERFRIWMDNREIKLQQKIKRKH